MTVCVTWIPCRGLLRRIGILGQASKMCSDMFGVSAAVGGGFAGLLSIFNMGGRFVWSSISDTIGRKAVMCLFRFCSGSNHFDWWLTVEASG